jgi:hypothetical protein
MSIVPPAPDEKRRAIEAIVEAGMPKPRSLGQAVRELVCHIGLRRLFFGLEDCIFLAVIVAAAAVLMFVNAGQALKTEGCALMFLLSPLLYIVLFYFTAFKESQSGTLEIVRSCKFSLRQLTAVRMLCFGGIGVLFDLVIAAALWVVSDGTYLFLGLIGLSLAALFLYAVLTMALLLLRKLPFLHHAAPVVWIILALFILPAGERTDAFLLNLPQAAVWFMLALFLVIYLAEIYAFLFLTPKGVKDYAVG